MNGKFTPPLLKFEEKYNSRKTGRNYFSSSAYNTIANSSKTYHEGALDTFRIYNSNPSGVLAALNECRSLFGNLWYDQYWTTRDYLKLEASTDKAEDAAAFAEKVSEIILGGPITQYYEDENGNIKGVCEKSGKTIKLSAVGSDVEKVKNPEDAGIKETSSGSVYYDQGSKNHGDEDEEGNTKKYVLIGLAVVAVIVTFIILKKKKKI